MIAGRLDACGPAQVHNDRKVFRRCRSSEHHKFLAGKILQFDRAPLCAGMAFRKARVEWFRPVAKSVEAARQFVSVDEAEENAAESPRFSARTCSTEFSSCSLTSISLKVTCSELTDQLGKRAIDRRAAKADAQDAAMPLIDGHHEMARLIQPSQQVIGFALERQSCGGQFDIAAVPVKQLGVQAALKLLVSQGSVAAVTATIAALRAESDAPPPAPQNIAIAADPPSLSSRSRFVIDMK